MYFNKLAPTVISAMFLLLILSSVNFSSVKLVNAATGDLVNYNNNFNMYTSPNDPNKDSAMQNANCVVNFMQTYVYAAGSADNCNNASTPATPAEQSQTPVQSQAYPPASDGPQTAVGGQSDSAGVVKVVDTNNPNGATFAPVQSTAFTSNQNNPNDNDDDKDKDARDKDNDDDDNDKDNNRNDDDDDDKDKDARDKDNDDDDDDKDNNRNDDDDDDDKDKDARDKDNDDDNDNNNNDDENKVYNESTVTKQERKLLLTACFERAYDKGNYLSTEEIVNCAENYNS
jgi:hypothetical protein